MASVGTNGNEALVINAKCALVERTPCHPPWFDADRVLMQHKEYLCAYMQLSVITQSKQIKMQ